MANTDRGEVTATVVMVPVVLLAMLLVVQFALAYHARTVISGAAQDGASAAARQNGDQDDGVALADALIADAAGALLDSHSASAVQTGDVITIEVEGEVVSLLPFFNTITIRATATSPIERFGRQGAGP